jgi:hypothetical protein
MIDTSGERMNIDRRHRERGHIIVIRANVYSCARDTREPIATSATISGRKIAREDFMDYLQRSKLDE